MKRVLDFLFLARPTLLLPGWGFFVIGHLHALNLMGDLRPWLGIPKGEFWWGLLSATSISAYIYVLNQIYDRESDRLNRKLFLIADGYIGVREAYVYAVFLLVMSFLFGYLVGREFLTLLVFGTVIGTLYSLPPFRFKGRPFLDMLSNAFGYAVLNVAAGYITASPDLAEALVITPPYFFAVCALYLNTTVPDIPGDRKAGLITTGVLLGERITSLLAAVCVALSAVFSLLPVFNPFMLTVSLLSLPAYLWAFLRGDEFSIKLAYRISGVAFVLTLVLKYPPFALPSVATLLALKLYYKIRFNYDYPSLTGR